LLLGAGLAMSAAVPAMAAETKTRLVDCAAGSCLLVTGYRAESASPITINGHAVAAQGARKWRAVVPVETLRAWSIPYARTITVAVADDRTQAALPIGLLGHVENLAFLTVSVK
jgi:hypothetical protein